MKCNRHVLLLAGAIAAALILVPGETAWAQGWPAYSGDPLERGPGMYTAWWKLLLVIPVFFLWVFSTDWVSRDTQEYGSSIGMPAKVWNPIVAFSFPVVFLTSLFIPMFAASYPVMIVGWIAPLGAYIGKRNGQMTEDRKVLTPKHIKTWLGNLGRKGGKKVEQKLPWQEGAPVEFDAAGATPQENQTNLIAARQSPSYLDAKSVVADALDRRAERVMLDFTREQVSVRYEIDGVWHNVDPMDRESADPILAVFKQLSGLNPAERRQRQDGRLKFKYKDAKYTGTIMSQGVKTGERVILRFDGGKKNLQSLDALGMREKLREQFKEMINAPSGMVVVSAMPSGGLTTTWTATLRATDRYMRDFYYVSDEGDDLPDVENLQVHPYNSKAGGSPDQDIPKLALKQPDVWIVPNPPNGETVRLLCEQVLKEERLVLTNVRAKDAVEALMRMLLLKAPADEFAQSITCVTGQRLIRKLCDKCRQAIKPDPKLLQKLGLPPDRVKVLYREYQPPPPGQEPEKKRGEPEVCPKCEGIGYYGQTAIIEMIKIDDTMRQVLKSQPKLELLRQAAKRAGNRSLQEEGILLVAKGDTSLAELQRVMKQ